MDNIEKTLMYILYTLIFICIIGVGLCAGGAVCAIFNENNADDVIKNSYSSTETHTIIGITSVYYNGMSLYDNLIKNLPKYPSLYFDEESLTYEMQIETGESIGASYDNIQVGKTYSMLINRNVYNDEKIAWSENYCIEIENVH